MWSLLSCKWINVGKTSKGKSQLPNSLLLKHRTSTTWSIQMAIDSDKDTNDKDARASFLCHSLTFV